ncbi:MAG: hypothetical protein OEY52_12405 [Gammaproteobacteria bacterium]|nr:hypothetical protein [Gammaproteobacteria bacterium]
MDSSQQIYKYLLKQNHQVVELITHSLSLHTAQRQLNPYINQYVKGYWDIGSCSQKELTILVSTPENAAKLRFQTNKILTEIRKLDSFKLLSYINIKVIPKEKTAITDSNLKIKKLKKPVNATDVLNQLSDSIEDLELKMALRRLANNLKN